MMIRIQDIDAACADERKGAAGRDRLNDRALDVHLHRGSAGAGSVDAASAQITRPEEIETAVFDQHGDRSIIFIGNGNRAAADDLAIHCNESKRRTIAEWNRTADGRHSHRSRRRP